MSAQGDGSEIFAKAKAKWGSGDLANARRLMKQAAGRDHLPAILEYAYFVENGIGGKLSIAKAMRWLEIAAKMGDPGALMRLGRLCLEQGDDARAKFWLNKVPHRRASLLLVKLHAKSRSVRSTHRAKHLLSIIKDRPEELSDAERVEFVQLEREFSGRNPDAIWAPNNRAVAERARKQERLFRERDRQMLGDDQQARPSALAKLIRALRQRLPGSSRPPFRRS